MKLRFLVGCYTSLIEESSLHILELNQTSKTLTLVNSHQVSNPSFSAFFPAKSIIYTVNENHGLNDRLTAVAFDREKLLFKTINEVDIKASDPCFISVDSKGKHVFSANYSDGTLSCVALNIDGSLGNLVQVIKHEIDPLDEAHPNTHMHAAVLSPDEQFLLVSNLGQDTITIYNYQASEEKPLTGTGHVYRFQDGTGPRHLIFDAAAKFVYVVGELDGSLHVLAWAEGTLTAVQRLMLMPPDFKDKNSAADLHFGASGDFLYVSNRGDANQIISFSIDQVTGKATVLDRTASLGEGPRNFAIDPSGKYMLVAHQYSNNIRLFEIDPLNGKLCDTGKSVQLNSPVYVSFL
ncbi:MAG: lactonase family protein [Pedobacter sp.]|nr:MAG: lactonase family protein [Pedobacter sp.]